MQRSADDILKMPDFKRRRLRLKKKFGHYIKEDRLHLSRDELLQYLRDRNIRSRIKFERVRKPKDPKMYDFRKEFGYWSEAVRLALGEKPAPEIDGDYILKAVWELNLFSVKRFKEARKIDKVAIPSWRQVIRTWGKYSNLFEAARRFNLKSQLEEYLRLIRRLGHVPNMKEIKEADLRMDDAITFYGGKKEMDDFVLTLRGL